MTSLRKLHQFLSSQLFYPVALSTLLALSFLFVRLFLSRHSTYAYLVWNLFLAWIPYLFSALAAGLHRWFPRRAWLLILPSALWLIFLPNAPYMVTDFFHLSQREVIPLWFDLGLLAAFAWTGLFLAIASLRTMQSLVKNYLGWITSWAFVAVVTGLNGLGVYLGRFLRWNSWDLVIQPITIVEDLLVRLANPLSHLGFFGFTLMFTAFLLVCYLMFTSVYPVRDPNH